MIEIASHGFRLARVLERLAPGFLFRSGLLLGRILGATLLGKLALDLLTSLGLELAARLGLGLSRRRRSPAAFSCALRRLSASACSWADFSSAALRAASACSAGALARTISETGSARGIDGQVVSATTQQHDQYHAERGPQACPRTRCRGDDRRRRNDRPVRSKGRRGLLPMTIVASASGAAVMAEQWPPGSNRLRTVVGAHREPRIEADLRSPAETPGGCSWPSDWYSSTVEHAVKGAGWRRGPGDRVIERGGESIDIGPRPLLGRGELLDR